MTILLQFADPATKVTLNIAFSGFSGQDVGFVKYGAGATSEEVPKCESNPSGLHRKGSWIAAAGTPQIVSDALPTSAITSLVL